MSIGETKEYSSKYRKIKTKIGIKYNNKYLYFLSSRIKKYLIKGMLKSTINIAKKKATFRGCKEPVEKSKGPVEDGIEVIASFI